MVPLPPTANVAASSRTTQTASRELPCGSGLSHAQPTRQGMHPSSVAPSQSSSCLLHVSAGGMHDAPTATAQPSAQPPMPEEPQVVTHGASGLPRQQANPLSQMVSPSSSHPLQTSYPLHAPQEQLA